MLTDEGIGYTYHKAKTPESQQLKELLLFDSTLQVGAGRQATNDRFGISINTSTRKLRMRVKSSFEMLDWIECFIDSILRNPYCRKNRFDSFSPRRFNNYCKPYIDNSQYYFDLADAIEQAKSEIYITDWWFTPELYLKRPINDSESPEKRDYWRLDNILKRATDRKVNIFVLLYKEFEHALPNNSSWARAKLLGLSRDRVKVFRHPQNIIFLWSHHEKMVIVDRKIGFMGGLDLCYGRWDNSQYPLREADYLPGQRLCLFPGHDYSNVRIKDFEGVTPKDEVVVNKLHNPRMPWRDVAVQLKGIIIKDLARHFIQYWNFAKYESEGKGGNNTGPVNKMTTANQKKGSSQKKSDNYKSSKKGDRSKSNTRISEIQLKHDFSKEMNAPSNKVQPLRAIQDFDEVEGLDSEGMLSDDEDTIKRRSMDSDSLKYDIKISRKEQDDLDSSDDDDQTDSVDSIVPDTQKIDALTPKKSKFSQQSSNDNVGIDDESSNILDPSIPIGSQKKLKVNSVRNTGEVSSKSIIWSQASDSESEEE